MPPFCLISLCRLGEVRKGPAWGKKCSLIEDGRAHYMCLFWYKVPVLFGCAISLYTFIHRYDSGMTMMIIMMIMPLRYECLLRVCSTHLHQAPTRPKKKLRMCWAARTSELSWRKRGRACHPTSSWMACTSSSAVFVTPTPEAFCFQKRQTSNGMMG